MRLSFRELDVGVDFYFVADNDATGFGDAAPNETEVLAVDLAADGEAGLGVPVEVLGNAAVLNGQGDGLCDVADRQVTRQVVVVATLWCEAGADELDFGELFGAEE